FAGLPVLEGGPVKPMDSLARNSLLMIRGQQSFQHLGRTVSADEWLLDVMFRPDVAEEQPVFVINDPEVLGLIGLPQTGSRYFAFKTLAPYLEEIQRQASAAEQIDTKQRSRFQSAVVNLFERLYLYYRLQNSIQLPGTPGLASELATLNGPAAAQRQERLSELAAFRPLPPLAGQPRDAWRSVGEALRAAWGGFIHPALDPLARLGAAYDANEPEAFNRALADFREVVDSRSPDSLQAARSEQLFNLAQPFYAGMVVYVLALLAIFASWMGKRSVLQPAAFGLLIAGALIHTAGLL